MRVLFVLSSLIFCLSLWAQPTSIETLPDGQVDVFATQRAAVDAMINRFAKPLRGIDTHHAKIVIGQLDEPQRLRSSNVGVTGSWGVNGVSGQIGEEVDKQAMDRALDMAASRLRVFFPDANISIMEKQPFPPENIVGELDQQRTPQGNKGGVTKSTVSVQSEIDRQALAGALELASTWLRTHFPDAKNSIIAKYPFPPENVIAIGISLGDVQRVSQSNPPMQGFRGRLKGILFSGDQTSSFETTFLHKPWVTEWSEFSNNQRPGGWVVGRSQQFCTNEGEADNFARFVAATQLVPSVQSRIDDGENVPENFIREKLIEQLRTQGPADRFVQRIDRPYGSLYQVAILVPTGDPLARQVAQTVSFQLANQKRAARSTIGGIIILSLVILVLYWFLNAVTKGYFTWRLRMAVVVILFLAGLLAFIALRFFAPRHVEVQSPRAVMIR